MSASLFSLEGKTAIVTGANTGLGQAIAVALGQAGANIVAVARSSTDETKAQVENSGARFAAIEADLAQQNKIGEVMKAADAAFGRSDILVNNAGVIRRNDALTFTEDDWDSVLQVNLKSLFFLSQMFARSLLDRGGAGKIINIASMLSFQGGIRVASYTASKSGVAGLTRLLANEWAAKGINVNAIAPGYFATNNTEALREDETRSRDILARIPAGRWGEPGDIGGATVFLASRAADYLHGAIIPVDGGWLCR